MVIVVSPLLKSVEDANFESEAGESVRSLRMPLTPTIEEAVKVIVVLCNCITMTTHFS